MPILNSIYFHTWGSGYYPERYLSSGHLQALREPSQACMRRPQARVSSADRDDRRPIRRRTTSLLKKYQTITQQSFVAQAPGIKPSQSRFSRRLLETSPTGANSPRHGRTPRPRNGRSGAPRERHHEPQPSGPHPVWKPLDERQKWHHGRSNRSCGEFLSTPVGLLGRKMTASHGAPLSSPYTYGRPPFSPSEVTLYFIRYFISHTGTSHYGGRALAQGSQPA